MSHPHAEHRQSKVEHRRVAHITRHYATGGAVHADEKADKALIRRSVKKTALKMEGGKPKERQDRRARGGRLKAKGTNVTVVVAPQGGSQMPMRAPVVPAGPVPAPTSPRPMGPPAGAMPPGLPSGMPPGMPPRHAGGRAYAKGGGVKSGPAWEEGLRNGTQVNNSPGKNDLVNIGRGRVVTFRTGGPVEAPKKGGMAPKLPGGAGGGEARLRKAKMVHDGMAP